MAEKVIAWDDVNDRPVRTTKDPSLIGTGPLRAASVSLGISTSTKTVTYSSPVADTNHAIALDLVNSVDSSPLFQTVLIKNKTVNGFTAFWNVPLDSANYILEYTVTAHS